MLGQSQHLGSGLRRSQHAHLPTTTTAASSGLCRLRQLAGRPASLRGASSSRHQTRRRVAFKASDSADAATYSQPQAPNKKRGASTAPRQGSSSSVADMGDDPAGPSSSQQRQGSTSTSSGSTTSSSSSSFLQQNPALLRKVLDSSSAGDAYELLVQHRQQAADQQQQQQSQLSAADVDALLRCCLEAGNVTLALSVYQQLQAAKRAAGSAAVGSAWPAATPQHTETLILGLCRQLRVADALAALASIRSHGVPGTDAEVSFGQVVNSPLPPRQPLAVVQPQEGCKVVSDSNSRYEFELFSGTVTSASSEALQPSSNPLLAAARAIGLLRRGGPVAAVHELVVQPPAGGGSNSSRTFRVGTATADVPAQVGQRVTVVCSPAAGANRLRRLVLSTSPPGTQPGEPLLVCNHTTGSELLLLRPPKPGTQTGGVPGWVLPAAVLLAGGDAASGLVDPALPLLIAGGLGVAVGSVVASNTLVVPSLKKLPAKSVTLETIRQQLLGQHARLDSKVKATMQEAGEDVRTLARLWQLQAKMQTVDGSSSSSSSNSGSNAGSSSGGSPSYEARIERVSAVAGGLEQRLSKRLELLDGYARVMSMIEIEVEMDMQVPVAELEGLGVELEKLSELESIREEWTLQAEAQDEVERLLRNTAA